MFNEGRKQRGSGRNNETKDQALERVRKERASRQQAKSQASSVHKVQSFVRGRMCVMHLRERLKRQFDTQIQRFQSDLLNNDLAQLINIFNWANLTGADQIKRLVGVSALLVKSARQPGGYFSRLSFDPASRSSSRSLLKFLRTCLDGLSRGVIPGPVEVIVLKCIGLLLDPSLGAGVPAAVVREGHTRLCNAGLVPAMMAVISRNAPLSAEPAVPKGCVDTALRIALMPCPGLTQCESMMQYISSILSTPCLTKRIPLTAYDVPWPQLVAVLPVALEAPERMAAGYSWRLWLLGNLMDLIVSGQLADVLAQPALANAVFKALAGLWQHVLPPKIAALVAGMKKMPNDEKGGLVGQLRSLTTLAGSVAHGVDPTVDAWVCVQPCALMLLEVIAGTQALRAPVLAVMGNSLGRLWGLADTHLDLDRTLRTCLLCGGDPDPLALGELRGAFELFLAAFNHWLIVQSDEELYEKPTAPFDLQLLVRLAMALKQAVLSSTLRPPPKESVTPVHKYSIATARMILLQLYDRHGRRPFCDEEAWLAAGMDWELLKQQVLSGDNASTRLLQQLPFVVPFETRIEIFDTWLRANRAAHKGQRHKVVIRRDHLIQDGVTSLGQLTAEQLKDQIAVTFIDVHGMEEPGIDISGVFKEYLSQLVTQGFAPDKGLFSVTEGRELYPNPASVIANGPEHLQLFEFLGQVLAKAVYDGIAVDVPFAYFFLSRLLGRYSSVNELPFLDEELHRSLMFLKTYEGELKDLEVSFTVTEDNFGEMVEKELIEGGADIPVTSHNISQYITLVAAKRLNTDIMHQTRAFQKGFHSIVPASWLTMFNQTQLQRVLNGNSDGDFQVDDLRKYVKFHSGYSDSHDTIQSLWQVLKEFTPQQRSLFLSFVTSCPRPPLLGFQALNPPFTIQMVDVGVSSLEFWHDAERLPTASTCFNLLKLPNFKWTRTLRKKLLLVITSGSGFSLS